MSHGEEALVDAIRRGDRDAFARAVRACQARLRSFAGSFLGDAADGDEVAQQALLDLWRDRARLSPGSGVLPHLIARVRHLCMHRIRSARRERARERSVAAEPAEPGATPLDSLVAAEGARDEERARERIAQMIAALDEEARTAVWMRLAAGASFDEIGEALGKEAHVVRGLVYRRLAEIKAKLEAAT